MARGGGVFESTAGNHSAKGAPGSIGDAGSVGISMPAFTALGGALGGGLGVGQGQRLSDDGNSLFSSKGLGNAKNKMAAP